MFIATYRFPKGKIYALSLELLFTVVLNAGQDLFIPLPSSTGSSDLSLFVLRVTCDLYAHLSST